LNYIGKSSADGRSVYRYTSLAVGPVEDPNLTGTLPKALPKKLLASLAPLLPAAQKAKLAPALASLPDPVPLVYTESNSVSASADTDTGVAVEEGLNQQIIAGLTVNGQTVPLLPVLAVDVSITPQDVKMLADKASSSARLLTIVRIAIPIVLLVIGLGLLVLACLRRKPKTLSPDPSKREATKGAAS
jgi:hypothetical protein